MQVGGRGGVPSEGVEAVSLNVHAYNPDGTGFALVYPSDIDKPHARSLSFTGGGVEASNRVTTRLAADGTIAIYVGQKASHLYVDVNGWYSTPDAASPGGEFRPLPPTRAVDTRSASRTGLCPTSTSQCTPLAAGTAKSVQITGRAGVPASGVSAVAVNLTVFNPPADGFLKAYRSGTVVSPLRTVSFEAGLTTSGSADLKLSANGRLDLYSNRSVDVAVDVVGYWTAAAPGATQRFVPLDPTRLLDTVTHDGVCSPSPCDRVGDGQTITVDVADHAGVPAAGATAVVLNVTTRNATSSGGAVYVWASGTTRPSVRTVAAEPNRFISNSATVALGDDGKIKVYAAGATDGVDIYLDVQGYYQRSPGGTWTYTYSGDGLRTSKTAPDGTTTKFTWDRSGGLPLLLAETIDAPGTSDDRTVRYIYGPTGHVLADTTTPAGGSDTVRWYHHDQLGSTRMLTDNAGAVLATFVYSPYGEAAGATGTATTPMGWAGEYQDTETGFVYLRARHYDPATGQFLTRDPLEALTRSSYGYAGNNPTNVTDPTGMCPFCVAFVVGAVIGGGIDLGGQVLGNAVNGCGLFDDLDWGNVAQSGLIGGGTSVSGAWLGGLRATQAVDDVAAAGARGTTLHGTERIAGAGATRGGVLNSAGIAVVRGGGTAYAQSNGAIARVLQQTNGRYSVVVDGNRGLITTFQNLSQNSLDRLAKNYGWTAL